MIDQDPFEIESWHEFFKTCSVAGKISHARKVLSDYIYLTNRPCQQEIRAYVNRRRGEWAQDTILEKVRRQRYEKEREREQRALRLQHEDQ